MQVIFDFSWLSLVELQGDGLGGARDQMLLGHSQWPCMLQRGLKMCLSSVAVAGLSWPKLAEEPFSNSIVFVFLSIC